MLAYQVGDVVRLPQGHLGTVGTVVYYDEPSDRYLVRIDGSQQFYFTAAQLTPWTPKNQSPEV